MWVYRDMWDWIVHNWDGILSTLVAFATTGAALAAWVAARAAQRSAKDTQLAVNAEVKAVEVQIKALQLTEQQLADAKRPDFSVSLRLDRDVLFLDLANHGGPARSISLTKPTLISDVPEPERLLSSALSDIGKSSAFLHGIDGMRSGEVISLPVGRLGPDDLHDELVSELGGMWMRGRQDFPVFEMIIGANLRFTTHRMYLDKTAQLRRKP